jgi:WS/DGAT/MGAT family acyltransferase
VATGLESSAPRRAAFERLSRQDLANLIVEAPDTPMHMAVLTILDGRHLHGSAAEDLLEQVRAHVEERLGRIPELRQVLSHARPLTGRPVWVDDPHVRVSAHVLAAAVPSPGREPELLATTEDLFQRLLDRSRPLWEIWLLTGLAEGRWAVFLKVHHAVTDGLGMLRIAETLFDNAPHVAPRDVTSWIPSAAPTWGQLSTAAAAAAARGLWRATAGLLHPIRLSGAATGFVTTVASVTGRTWTGRRARLNHPIGPRRTLAVIHLDLASVKRTAHEHGATVNDTVLELAAAGIRAALHSRGESLRGLRLRALMAVNPPPGIVSGPRNRAGSVMVSLPLEPTSSSDRIHAIAADSRRARRWQRPGVVERSLVLVTRIRLGRFLSRHQKVVDMAVSNLMGPPQPLYLIGCRLVDAIPITPISGNVTISFCALSYAGRFDISVLADATSWSDLPVVVEAMRSGWTELSHETVAAAASAS